MELNERVVKCETKIEVLEGKIDRQDRLIDSIYELASGQKELNSKMDNIEHDLSSVKNDVKDLQLQPAKDYKKLGFEAVKFILLFMVGYFCNMFIK